MSKLNSLIPIKNVFFMLCYAWNILSIKDTVKLQSEDLDDAYNLLTRLLVFGVQKLVRRGFLKKYINVNDELTCLKGKINISETINYYSRNERKCNCEYDEFSKNNNFNKIIKHTIKSVIRNENVNNNLKKELRTLLVYFLGVDEAAPTKSELSKLMFNANNKHYKMIINVCSMIYNGTLVNEEEGNRIFMDFFREEQMQKVYELFILNFYAINLDRKKYKVHAPKIKWDIDNDAEELWGDDFVVETDLGDRRTDVVLENINNQVQFIIDAKYYKDALVAGYMDNDKNRVRTGHINQIGGYIQDSEFDGRKYGALVYPRTIFDLDKVLAIKDKNIFLKTVNLNQEWKLIETDLLSFAHKVLDKQNKV